MLFVFLFPAYVISQTQILSSVFCFQMLIAAIYSSIRNLRDTLQNHILRQYLRIINCKNSSISSARIYFSRTKDEDV